MSTSQKFSVNQKGLAPILIVLILAALVGGYFLYQQQAKSPSAPTTPPATSSTFQPSPSPADQTANWKIYTNNRANFSFSYPNNWFISEQVSNNTVKDIEITSCDLKNNPFCTREKNQITISARLVDKADVYEGAKNMEEYYQRQAKSSNSGKNKRSVTLDNLSAIRFSTIGGEGDMEGVQGNGDIVGVDYKGNLYTLKVSINVGPSGKSDNLNEAINIFNQILSTFKFTE